MNIVYIETSIVSFASARPSRDIQTAALQQQARDWWDIERPQYDLVTSQLAITEASAGDPTAAADRLNMLNGIPLVDIGADAQDLAKRILDAHMMPRTAAADALHIAAAALAGVRYLLTLNCKHIANAHELPRVYELLGNEGFGRLLFCTPAEFLGGDGHDEDTSDP